MKKVLMGILSLIMILGLVGCSSTPAVEEKSIQTESQTPEPTSTETSSNWEIANYVDDFGDETEDFYIQGVFSGKFSNTSTTNEDLTVVVMYDYDVPEIQTNLNPATYSMSFRLLEFNDHKATFNSRDNITLKVKINDKITEYNLSGTEPNGDLIIVEKERNYRELPILTSALEKNEYEISCIIEIGSSKYSFKLNGTGFLEQKNSLDEIKSKNK